LDDWNLIKNGINQQSTGAGFLSSTISHESTMQMTGPPLEDFNSWPRLPQFLTRRL
jgi:hypothetical protein